MGGCGGRCGDLDRNTSRRIDFIDSGNPGGRDAKRIIQATKEAGLDRIDHLLTTHFHVDHFGGAAEVAQALPIGTIYDNGIPEKNPDNPTDTGTSFQRSIQPYREIKAKHVVLKPGDLLPLKQAGGETLSLRCIGAMQKTVSNAAGGKVSIARVERKRRKTRATTRTAWCSLLKYGQFDLFDGGDLTWNNDNTGLPANLIGTVDIYDVDHHGLDVSNNPLLIRAIEPTVAIMGNGTTKGCGAETFSTLKGTPSIQAIYQLHRNLRKDSENNTGPEFIANEEKDCQANYVKVSVAEDTKSYTINIPAKKHSRVFQSR